MWTRPQRNECLIPRASVEEMRNASIQTTWVYDKIALYTERERKKVGRNPLKLTISQSHQHPYIWALSFHFQMSSHINVHYMHHLSFFDLSNQKKQQKFKTLMLIKINSLQKRFTCNRFSNLILVIRSTDAWAFVKSSIRCTRYHDFSLRVTSELSPGCVTFSMTQL